MWKLLTNLDESKQYQYKVNYDGNSQTHSYAVTRLL